jgi:hypothetical protein
MISYYVTNAVVHSEPLVYIKTCSLERNERVLKVLLGVEATEVITTSSERSFQSALKSKRHLVQQNKENKQARAIVSVI